MTARYTYLPWVRQGLIGALAGKPVTLGAVPAGTFADGRIELKVHANVEGETRDMASRTVSVLLFGPGDVTGFDARQVIRTDPRHLTPDFEPNYFPLIEFDRPDFPWLFTPAGPNGHGQLQPWICLIVVERRGDVEIGFQEGQPLPVLTIGREAYKELPDLAEAWAWAHVQVITDEQVQTALESQAERTLARLICPRHLKEKTAYYACVVPTYQGGIQAGLGQPVDGAAAMNKGWNLDANSVPPPPDTIRLPVYYHWEFSTGAQGDFEALVWQLERRQLSFEEAGTRKLDISHAGYGLPAGDAVDLMGVLGPQAQPDDDSMVGPTTAYQQRLQVLLNETALPPLPVLPPPIYGRWAAAQRTIPDAISLSLTRDQAWLRAINLDPRYRVAAGLGAQIIRDQQEQLMGSAWEQVGEIERANQILRQAQLARAASTSIHQERFGKLDAATFLSITAAVHPRVRLASAQTARGALQASNLPVAATSAQFRRMLRPRGAIAQRFGIAELANRNELIARLNRGEIRPAPQHWPAPDGMVSMERVLDRSLCNVTPAALAQAAIETWPPEQLIPAIEQILKVYRNGRMEINGFDQATQDQLEQAAKLLFIAHAELEGYVTEVGRPGSADVKLILARYRPALARIAEACWMLIKVVGSFQANPSAVITDLEAAMRPLPPIDELRNILFRLAAIEHLQDVEPCDDENPPAKPPLDLELFQVGVQAKLNPAVTIADRVGMLIQAPGWKADSLDFVFAAPDFPTPMYKELAKLSQEWMLPGIGRIPQNTLTLVESNNRFIEAFMVGLNHEMSRELLWRGYPTDQRGTYFRQFWDASGRFPVALDANQHKENLEKGKDIPPIHEWGEAKLGDSFGKQRARADSGVQAPTIAQIVLLIRGDLLRRYPHAGIFMVKAAWDGAVRTPVDITDDKDETQVVYPLFHGELSPDISFLGFSLRAGDAAGDEDIAASKPGWFLVIQQQPTEPRYGLDETAAPSNTTWRDLAWPHVKPDRSYDYIRLSGGLLPSFASTAQKAPASEPTGTTWNWSATTDSAQLACITLQGPVRIAIHASDLL